MRALAEERSREKPVEVPAEIGEFVERCHREPRFFIQALLSVVPIEGGQPVEFRLNAGQRKVMDVFEERLASDEPIRLIVLKSRRHGISTLCSGLGYWKTSTAAFVKGIVIAHKKDVTQELFLTTKLFHDLDKRRMLPGALPQTLASNEKALRFGVPVKDRKDAEDLGLQSSLLVETAEGSGVAVGLTLQFAHMSEVSKWANPKIMAGLGIALSKTPGSVGIMESTAEGFDPVFKPTWDKAVEGKNEWTPVFLSWLIDEKWSTPLGPKEKDSWEFTDRYERDLHEVHGASLEQLKWRRMMIASPECFRPGVRPEDVFKQEFPTTPEEAFLGSGKHFFLPEALSNLEKSSKGPKPPLRRVTLVSPLKTRERGFGEWGPVIPLIREDRYGVVEMWEDPQPGEDYCLGGDVAEGLSRGDASVAYLLRRSNQRVVAKVKGQTLEPDDFAEQCALLGWLYGTALLGIEVNGPGILANKTLRTLHYKRVFQEKDVTRIDEPEKEVFGWRTTPGNRRFILEELEMALRLGEFGMPDVEFYRQAPDFQLVDVGTEGNLHTRPQAVPGKHDDEIMAAAVMWQMHRRSPIRVQKAPKAEAFKVDFRAPVAKPERKARRSNSYDWF
jgi:hypothetical protein